MHPINTIKPRKKTVNHPFKSCLLSSMSSGLLITSRCTLSLSPALSCLDVIKYYYLSLCPRLRVPVPPSCVHRDRRPDQTVSGVPGIEAPRFRPFTSFCFVRFFKWLFCSCVLSLTASESASPHARRSREFMPPFAALPSHGSWEFT